MKNLKTLLILTLILTNLSCSSDDTTTDEISEYAMTAKINGELYKMNNPFGTNEASSSFFSYYPDEDYILLQGRYGGPFGNPEINIWINRDDLAIGTYQVGPSTDGVTTHIDLIDNSNDTAGNPVYENTVSGSISITSINSTEKTVKGTFNFDTVDGYSETNPVNFTVTEGTFNYKYDVE